MQMPLTSMELCQFRLAENLIPSVLVPFLDTATGIHFCNTIKNTAMHCISSCPQVYNWKPVRLWEQEGCGSVANNCITEITLQYEYSHYCSAVCLLYK